MNRTTPEPLLRMHRVLGIPELLDMIFSFLKSPSNAVNARVCKRWSEIALDLLWRDVDDLHRLFGTLAPLRKTARNEYEFDRLPEAGDWRRFEKYGSRIRRLVYKSNSKTMKQSVFDEIARTRTRLDILPNMHTLHWNAPLSLSLIFMHSGVKHLTVFLPCDLIAVSPRPFFHDVIARMPNLTTLDIRSTVPMNAIQEEMIDLLSSLSKLHKVVFPRFYVTTKVAEVLSRLEHLSIIEFQYGPEQGCGAPGDVEPFQPVLTEGAFPALWDHSITASFDDVARFVDIPFAPTNLTTIYVDSDVIETPQSVHDILSILSENCQMLKFLALVSLRDASTAFLIENPFDQTMVITMETLQPVLKLINLTSLELAHQYPLALKQHDIELLAATWPALETLLLNTEPVYSENSNLTLEALTPFAKYCPKLTHLGIFLDATIVETPLALSATYPTPVFQRLRRLSMGVSIIKDDHTVALYLSQLLPLQCALDCGITWEESYIAEQIDKMVQDRCDVWNRVADFLPLLTRLRLEERAKSKAMLEELEDLRMRTTVMKETAAMGIRLDLSTCVMI